MLGSGCSCIGDRPGSARQCKGGPCHATDETPTCPAARVRPDPETHAVDVADPADGQRPGWVVNSEWTGSLREHVCETLRGLRGVFCSQSARRRFRTGRAHVLAWRTPRIARFFFLMRRWRHGCSGSRNPAGGSNSLPDGAVHEGTRYTCSCMTSRARSSMRG